MIEKRELQVDLSKINLHQSEDLININREVDVGVHIPQDIIGKGYEFTQIRTNENIELSNLWARLNKIMENLYIQSAGKEGLSAYRRLINDESIKGDLEEQRRSIYSLWNMLRKWTHRTLEEWLNNYVGKTNYRLRLNYNEYEIYFELFIKKGTSYQGDVLKRLREIIPANLGIKISYGFAASLDLFSSYGTYNYTAFLCGEHPCGDIPDVYAEAQRMTTEAAIQVGANNAKNYYPTVAKIKSGEIDSGEVTEIIYASDFNSEDTYSFEALRGDE